LGTYTLIDALLRFGRSDLLVGRASEILGKKYAQIDYDDTGDLPWDSIVFERSSFAANTTKFFVTAEHGCQTINGTPFIGRIYPTDGQGFYDFGPTNNIFMRLPFLVCSCIVVGVAFVDLYIRIRFGRGWWHFFETAEYKVVRKLNWTEAYEQEKVLTKLESKFWGNFGSYMMAFCMVPVIIGVSAETTAVCLKYDGFLPFRYLGAIVKGWNYVAGVVIFLLIVKLVKILVNLLVTCCSDCCNDKCNEEETIENSDEEESIGGERKCTLEESTVAIRMKVDSEYVCKNCQLKLSQEEEEGFRKKFIPVKDVPIECYAPRFNWERITPSYVWSSLLAFTAWLLGSVTIVGAGLMYINDMFDGFTLLPFMLSELAKYVGRLPCFKKFVNDVKYAFTSSETKEGLNEQTNNNELQL